MKLETLIRAIAAVGSAVLLALAFPPISESKAAWLGLAPLMVVALTSRPRQAFLWGFVCGLLFWLTTLSWLVRLADTGTNLPLALLGWVLLSSYCALYMALFAMMIALLFGVAGGKREVGSGEWRVASGNRQEEEEEEEETGSGIGTFWAVKFLFGAPILWVGLEYVRSIFATGFPWNALGISQYENLPMIQSASWGGVYAVSAVTVVMNAAIALTAIRFIGLYRWKTVVPGTRFSLLMGLLVCSLFWMTGFRQLLKFQNETKGPEVRVVAIQPNVPQLKKWSESFARGVYDTLQRQTETAGSLSPHLIIWPETALPRVVNADIITALFVSELAMKGVPILVGSMEVVQEGGVDFTKPTTREEFLASMDDEPSASPMDLPASGVPVFCNSSFLYGIDGTVIDRYRKQHLVPFGEFLPLDKKIAWIARLAPLGWTCTPGERETVFKLSIKAEGQKDTSESTEVAFSSMICFEDAFAYIARGFVKKGARFLVNQTNDAWFDGSSAAVQHMSHCVFRCVENRVGAVRSANTGVTCFIDKSGAIDQASRTIIANDEAGMTEQRADALFVQGEDMPLTLYTRYGDWVLGIPCALLTAAALLFMVGRKKIRQD
jgi:apolipoprotein N-acyltransferase